MHPPALRKRCALHRFQCLEKNLFISQSNDARELLAFHKFEGSSAENLAYAFWSTAQAFENKKNPIKPILSEQI